MARSYKKTCIVKDGGPTRRKFAKRQANKKVRRYKGYISHGNSYKKIFNSWEIYDYISLCSFQKWCKRKEPAIHKYWNEEYTEKELYNDWAKYYYRK